jgi:hypothetical protein
MGGLGALALLLPQVYQLVDETVVALAESPVAVHPVLGCNCHAYGGSRLPCLVRIVPHIRSRLCSILFLYVQI